MNLVSRCVEPDHRLLDNIRHSITLGLPEFGCSLVRNNGDFIICASGPSIAEEVDSIREWRAKGATICSVNDTHDWLISNGITPDIHVMLDPTEQLASRVKSPTQGVIYLIASQCHPAVFERLKGFDVVLFHAMALIGEEEILGDRMRVGGGTTVGLRSVHIGYLLGFHKFHLYGMDSSLRDGKLRITGEGVKNNNIMEIVCGGRTFYANPAMAGQAEEIQQLLNMFAGSIELAAYGDGLLPFVIKERKRLMKQI